MNGAAPRTQSITSLKYLAKYLKLVFVTVPCTAATRGVGPGLLQHTSGTRWFMSKFWDALTQKTQDFVRVFLKQWQSNSALLHTVGLQQHGNFQVLKEHVNLQ